MVLADPGGQPGCRGDHLPGGNDRLTPGDDRQGRDRPGGIVERQTAIELWERHSGLRADPDGLHWWDVFTNVKLQGIWLKGAKEFQQGRTNELILPMIGFTLINSQDRALLKTMGKQV